MRKRPVFRCRKGYWNGLCHECLKAVIKYQRGGWGELFGPMKCDRCGESAAVEFYPSFASGRRKK